MKAEAWLVPGDWHEGSGSFSWVWLPCAGPPGTGEGLRISDFGLQIGPKGSHAGARGRGEDGEKGDKERGRDGGTEGQRDKGTWGTRRHGVLSIEYSA